MTITQIEEQIFKVGDDHFEELALQIFQYQSKHILVYKQYIDALGIIPSSIQSLLDIPFLPIQFFKTHQVFSAIENTNPTLFESSGTTGQIRSTHFVSDISLYEKSFLTNFELFFGSPEKYCILGLLPSYLERKNSSLVYMVDSLICKSLHPRSGFYLHNVEELNATLIQLEQKKQTTILFGVTYALLDFAEKFPIDLKTVNVVETGGMKGKREELLRNEMHTILKKSFGLEQIFSEYGMTELLSQAYSLGDGLFNTPPWMKMIIRDLNDPFQLAHRGKGALNVIDLANLHSCCFIATDDVGEVFGDYSFMVNGRLDNSDIRGCSLMAI